LRTGALCHDTRRGGSITDELGPSFFHFFTPQSLPGCARLAPRLRSAKFPCHFFIAYLLVYIITAHLTLNCCFGDLCRLSHDLHSYKTPSNKMAPNGHASADPRSGDHEHQSIPPPVWHESHGPAEFKNWQKENPTQHLSYEDWKSSKHVAGLSLYYAALRIWDESDSSVSD
jgi:hypothetical protein